MFVPAFSTKAYTHTVLYYHITHKIAILYYGEQVEPQETQWVIFFIRKEKFIYKRTTKKEQTLSPAQNKKD